MSLINFSLPWFIKIQIIVFKFLTKQFAACCFFINFLESAIFNKCNNLNELNSDRVDFRYMFLIIDSWTLKRSISIWSRWVLVLLKWKIRPHCLLTFNWTLLVRMLFLRPFQKPKRVRALMATLMFNTTKYNELNSRHYIQ